MLNVAVRQLHALVGSIPNLAILRTLSKAHALAGRALAAAWRTGAD